jgi:hypothetical protein
MYCASGVAVSYENKLVSAYTREVIDSNIIFRYSKYTYICICFRMWITQFCVGYMLSDWNSVFLSSSQRRYRRIDSPRLDTGSWKLPASILPHGATQP